jgi:hypothetical protein
MAKPETTSRWFSNWRMPTAVPEHDPADLGTAFGLDLSLEDERPQPAAPVAPVARQPGWMSRLAARRRSAA